MTDLERIARLEQMVKTLSEVLCSVTRLINSSELESNLYDLREALLDIDSYQAPE